MHLDLSDASDGVYYLLWSSEEESGIEKVLLVRE